MENDVNAEGQVSLRGMAIKVYDPEGEYLIEEPGIKAQDFLLINSPVFAISNVSDYLELNKIQLQFKDNIMPFFAGAPDLPPSKLKTLQIVGAIGATQVANLVDSDYFSATLFLLGPENVVKFSASPRTKQNTPMPSNPSPNYLREALTATLDVNSGTEVIFDFKIQVRKNDSQIVEDASNEWSQTDSPFFKMAEIRIKPQNFNTPERQKLCDDLVFTPWHAAKALQPIGGINRLRKAAYIASSKFRKR